jgi:hypothetical protein
MIMVTIRPIEDPYDRTSTFKLEIMTHEANIVIPQLSRSIIRPFPSIDCCKTPYIT